MPEERDFRKEAAEKLLERIEHGDAPWLKPWEAAGRGSPHNPVSGTRYRGGNRLWLAFQGYDDPRWVTFNQAKEQGWHVRKGERGTRVEFWQFHEDKKERDPVTGKEKTVRVELERPKVYHWTVFNARQIEGMPEPERTIRDPLAENLRAEEILRASGAVIRHQQGDRAFYSLSRDEICLPLPEQFRDAAGYYGTALHELAHWTGHESRLDRTFGRFGDEPYAKEELRAEMASYFLALETGIAPSHEHVEQHAAYCRSWAKVIREDKNELICYRLSEKVMSIIPFRYHFA